MKRANGTGSISRLSGNRRRPWVIRVAYRDKDDMIRQKMLGTYATRKEAQQALDEYNRSSGQSALRIDQFNATIGDIYDAWQVKAFEGLTESGRGNYTGPWKRRLQAYSERRIRSMGIDDWQSIVDSDAAQGLSGGAVSKLIVLIKALNRYAAMRDIIGKDYSQYIEMPVTTATKAEKGSLSPEQVERLKEMASGGDMWAGSVLILCYTGFRIDEFLSLTPGHYHAEPVPYFKQGSKTEAGKGKDGMGREVPVSPVIQPYVDAWLEKGGKALVCKEGGGRYSRDGYIPHFNAVMEQLGLPKASPHWCRYTFETMCKRAGIQPDLIDVMMGHSSKSMGSHYTDWKLSDKAEAVNKLP